MTRRRRRLWIILGCGLCLGTAAALVLTAFNDNLVFFVSPTDLAGRAVNGRMVRLGGLVEPESVVRGSPGKAATMFRVTDGAHSVAVTYNGILPDLFREGQGVVTLGTPRPDGSFLASEVLAKHDETYMPKEVAEALKKSGKWKPETGSPPPAAIWKTDSSPTTGG